MDTKFGIVLYVVAKDAVQGKSADRRGPRGGNGLTKGDIETQIESHTGKRVPSRPLVNAACEYLTRHNYFALKGKRYTLHERLTTPTLILNKLDAEIVLTVANKVGLDELFKMPDAVFWCSKAIAGASEDMIRGRIEKLSESIEEIQGYFLPIDKDQGSFQVNSQTIEEERPYLDCVVKWAFKMTKPIVVSAIRKPAGRKVAPKRKVATRTARGGKTRGR